MYAHDNQTIHEIYLCNYIGYNNFKSVEIPRFIVRIYPSCNLYTDFDKLQFWNGFFWIGCYCHWCRLSILFLVRCLGVFIVIVWQNISGSSDIDKDEIIKFSVTYSLYFIAQIRTRMLRWWHCSKSQKYACHGKIGNIFMLYRSIESPFYLPMLLADFFSHHAVLFFELSLLHLCDVEAV